MRRNRGRAAWCPLVVCNELMDVCVVSGDLESSHSPCVRRAGLRDTVALQRSCREKDQEPPKLCRSLLKGTRPKTIQGIVDLVVGRTGPQFLLFPPTPPVAPFCCMDHPSAQQTHPVSTFQPSPAGGNTAIEKSKRHETESRRAGRGRSGWQGHGSFRLGHLTPMWWGPRPPEGRDWGLISPAGSQATAQQLQYLIHDFLSHAASQPASPSDWFLPESLVPHHHTTSPPRHLVTSG